MLGHQWKNSELHCSFPQAQQNLMKSLKKLRYNLSISLQFKVSASYQSNTSFVHRICIDRFENLYFRSHDSVFQWLATLRKIFKIVSK